MQPPLNIGELQIFNGEIGKGMGEFSKAMVELQFSKGSFPFVASEFSILASVGLAAIARGIGTLKLPQMEHSGTVVLVSLVFRGCFYLHQFLFLPLVLTPTNY